MSSCCAVVVFNLAPSSLSRRRSIVSSCKHRHNVASRSCIRAEIHYVNAREAKKLVAEEGYKILDVRDDTQFKRAHIKSCHHVPLFVENTDNDIGTIVKRTLHNNFSGLFFGKPFTKPNKDFLSSIEQQFSKDSKLLIVCQEGLRSGVAARQLEVAGYQHLSYITSGLQSVEPGIFEREGTTELQEAGKAGLITIQGKISVVLGAILIKMLRNKRKIEDNALRCTSRAKTVALLLITVFPEEAEKFLKF